MTRDGKAVSFRRQMATLAEPLRTVAVAVLGEIEKVARKTPGEIASRFRGDEFAFTAFSHAAEQFVRGYRKARGRPATYAHFAALYGIKAASRTLNGRYWREALGYKLVGVATVSLNLLDMAGASLPAKGVDGARVNGADVNGADVAEQALRALEGLEPYERFLLIRCRVERFTFRAAGAEIGMSGERVRQIVEAAAAKARFNLWRANFLPGDGTGFAQAHCGEP